MDKWIRVTTMSTKAVETQVPFCLEKLSIYCLRLTLLVCALELAVRLICCHRPEKVQQSIPCKLHNWEWRKRAGGQLSLFFYVLVSGTFTTFVPKYVIYSQGISFSLARFESLRQNKKVGSRDRICLEENSFNKRLECLLNVSFLRKRCSFWTELQTSAVKDGIFLVEFHSRISVFPLDLK